MQAALADNWALHSEPRLGFWRSGSLRWLLLASLVIHLLVLLLPPLWDRSTVVRDSSPLLITVVQEPPVIQATPETVPESEPEISPESEVRSIPMPPTTITQPSQTSSNEQPEPVQQDQRLSKSEQEWVQEGRVVAEQILREEADRAARMAAQWFRAPSIMWGEVPRVFDREYVLTHFRPTGLLGDPAVLMRGKEFRGIGIPLGENCFLGLPKVDVEQQYYDYSQRLPSVYPEPEVASLNLYSCGFSTSGQ